MINYTTQIINLSEAKESIQEAINESVDSTAKGKMYLTQDMLTAQIKTIMALETAQEKENEGQTIDVDFLSALNA